MSIRNQNWYNLQSTRSYPIDELSTCVDDAGKFVRNDIIVDCHIKFPATLGAQMYVQGITISAGIVTLLFGVTGGKTVAVVSLPKPVVPYVNYAITGLVPGISGWVVFGPGIDTDFAGRYSAVTQTAIQPRCARPYRALPIPSIGKLNLPTALTGVVNMTATTPVNAVYETVTVGGVARPAIVFRLDSAQISTTYNPMIEFLGPCGQRPESGTCPKTPIETINGVAPDCNGNINIEFVGFSANNFNECGGFDLLTDVGLVDVCAANKPKNPQEFTDECCTAKLLEGGVLTFASRDDFPSTGIEGQLYIAFNTNKVYQWLSNAYVKSDVNVDAYCWPDSTKNIDIIVDQTLFNPNYSCLTLPLCLDFGACTESTQFAVRLGRFAPSRTTAPGLCPCNGNAGAPGLTNHYTYLTTGVSSVNVSVLRNCPSDWAIGKSISAELKISTAGSLRNGGLTLGYKQVAVEGGIITTYFVVLVDVTNEKLSVLRYSNGQFFEEVSVAYAFKPKIWYTVSAFAVLNPGQPGQPERATLQFSVKDTLRDLVLITGQTEIDAAKYVGGFYGVFSNQSYTFFNKFTVS